MKFKINRFTLPLVFYALFSWLFDSFCFSQSYMCKNRGPFYEIVFQENTALLIGEFVNVIHSPSDTLIDTVEIDYNIDIDTAIGSENEKKKNKMILKIKKLQIEKLRNSGELIRNDSAVVRKILKWKPYVFVVRPESICSMPLKLDTASFQSYASDSLKSHSYNGKYVFAGRILKSPMDSVNVYVVLERQLYFKPINENLNYDCKKETNYRSTLKSDAIKIDWEFELLKDLMRLGKINSIERRLKTLRNLMYHKYFLDNPRQYEVILNIFTGNNEKERNNLSKSQREKSEYWKEHLKSCN